MAACSERAAILRDARLQRAPQDEAGDNASIQRLAFDGAAAQRARLLLRPIGARVQAGKIVPHQEVADAPFVIVDDLVVLRDREALLQDRLALGAVMPSIHIVLTLAV